jgi:adenine-specific DNA methylase
MISTLLDPSGTKFSNGIGRKIIDRCAVANVLRVIRLAFGENPFENFRCHRYERFTGSHHVTPLISSRHTYRSRRTKEDKDSSFSGGNIEDIDAKLQGVEEPALDRVEAWKACGADDLPGTLIGKATVIAWIWSRTVPSPDPAFADVQVPIASSFLLSTKTGKEAWIEPIIDKQAKTINYRIRHGGTKAEITAATDGTKAGRGANFRCIVSDTAITPEYVKAKGKAGEMGQILLAIVAEGKRSRVYVEPTTEHTDLAFSAKPEWSPETPLPNDPRNFWTVDYGLDTFGKLFMDRQLIALNTFSDLVHEARVHVEADAARSGLPAADPTPLRDGGKGAKAYAEAVGVYLGMSVSKASVFLNSLSRWRAWAIRLMALSDR